MTLSASGTRPIQIVAPTLIDASILSSISGTNTTILTRWRADWDVTSEAGVIVCIDKIWVTSACIGS